MRFFLKQMYVFLWLHNYFEQIRKWDFLRVFRILPVWLIDYKHCHSMTKEWFVGCVWIFAAVECRKEHIWWLLLAFTLACWFVINIDGFQEVKVCPSVSHKNNCLKLFNRVIWRSCPASVWSPLSSCTWIVRTLFCPRLEFVKLTQIFQFWDIQIYLYS